MGVDMGWARGLVTVALLLSAVLAPGSVPAEENRGQFVIVWSSAESSTGAHVIAARSGDDEAGSILIDGGVATLNCWEIIEGRDGSMIHVKNFIAPDPMPTMQLYFKGVLRVSSYGAIEEAAMGVSRTPTSEDQCGAGEVQATVKAHAYYEDIAIPY